MVCGRCLCIGVAAFGIAGLCASGSSKQTPWEPGKAAQYLDARTLAWTQGGAMDHGTFCISCHTGLPFAESRSSLLSVLSGPNESGAEHTLFTSVRQRVRLWGQVQPYLGDKTNGLATESVINAVVLATRDA